MYGHADPLQSLIGGEDLKINVDLGVHLKSVDESSLRVGAIGSFKLHLVGREQIADDKVGNAFEVFALIRLDAAAGIDIKLEYLQLLSMRADSG